MTRHSPYVIELSAADRAVLEKRFRYLAEVDAEHPRHRAGGPTPRRR